VTYCIANLDPSLAAALPKDGNGFFVVSTPTRIEHVPPWRPDIALMLMRQPRPKARPSPRHAGALERARKAVTKADAVLGRTARRSELSTGQRRAVDNLSHADMAESFGLVLGRELARRDARIRALEGRALAADPQAVRARARAAIHAAEAVL